MYGIVNKAIRKMVVENHGEDAWDGIREKAGADDIFIGMDQYPDEVTVNLVMAASEALGASPADVMRGFGEYWVDFVGETYGDLFNMTGDTFVMFVQNLNNLHTRVHALMPELQPPSFIVTDQKDGSFVLEYHSIRDGLHPMITGLMKGLGARFNTEVTITRQAGAEDGLDHDRFLVEYASR